MVIHPAFYESNQQNSQSGAGHVCIKYFSIIFSTQLNHEKKHTAAIESNCHEVSALCKEGRFTYTL